MMLSCTDSKTTSETKTTSDTATVKMITIDGKYKVWTQKFGSGKIKVLMLHGGPGFCHDYLLCFNQYLLYNND